MQWDDTQTPQQAELMKYLQNSPPTQLSSAQALDDFHVPPARGFTFKSNSLKLPHANIHTVGLSPHAAPAIDTQQEDKLLFQANTQGPVWVSVLSLLRSPALLPSKKFLSPVPLL